MASSSHLRARRFRPRAQLSPLAQARTTVRRSLRVTLLLSGIPRANVRFCRARAEKAVHCARLSVTHMIDDRLDVHRALYPQVAHLFLFGVQTEPVPDRVWHTATRPEVETAVAATLLAQP
ncbi:hypothetical protein [Nocardia bovistercoris]|uniref:Uncharacterized protein n=1 Tax=Nocardia bovistercoris TaxID=2785916 RepID=A0A931IHE6_9NOCA|nr:hypothetical protein [Nocardia bovistercoris]MBH0781629.1 hypothetical protein [Nocardia bovistercoris]